VSREHEPPPPAELTELLRGMRADTLTAAELAQLVERLGPHLGHGAGGGTAPPAVSPVRGAIAATGAGASVIAIGIAIFVAQDVPAERHRAREPAAAVSVSDAVRGDRDHAPDVADDPGRGTATVDPAPPTDGDPSAAPAGTTAPGADVATPAIPRDERARAARPATTEHELLADARRALAIDPARALELAERHRREFREGALAPEREMLAVDALSALGRVGAARRRAIALAERWPRSGYADRVRARGLVE
jgi:hypothetical protein